MHFAKLPWRAAAIVCLAGWMAGTAVQPAHAAGSTRAHSPASAPAPVVPLAPPPAAVIPPLDPAPAHAVTPPTPPPVKAGAPGEAIPIAGGLRLTFGEDRADFSPQNATALKTLAETGLGNRKLVFNLFAHAAGGTEDTSSPRRLSLQRGLAVRSALMAGGIGSTRIYVHALGATRDASSRTDDAAPDRVDIVTASLDTAPPAAAPHQVAPAPTP